MNTMKRTLLGACAVFACVGVATADTDDGSVNLYTGELGTLVVSKDGTQVTFDLSDAAIDAGVSVGSAIDSATSAVSTVVEEIETSLQIAQRIVGTGVVIAVTEADIVTNQEFIDTSVMAVTEADIVTNQEFIDTSVVAVTETDITAAEALVNGAIGNKYTASKIINATFAVNESFSKTDLDADKWDKVVTASEVDESPIDAANNGPSLQVEEFYFAEVNAPLDSSTNTVTVKYFTASDDRTNPSDGQDLNMTPVERTAWLEAYYAKQAVANQAILDAGLQDDVVMADFIRAKMVVDAGVIEIVTEAQVTVATDLLNNGTDYTKSTGTTFEINNAEDLIVARNAVKDGLTGDYTLAEINKAEEVVSSSDATDDEKNLANVIMNDGLTGDDTNVTLGEVRTAQGEIDKVVQEGYTVDQLIEAEELRAAGEITKAVTQDQVDDAQTVLDNSLIPTTTLIDLLEAKVIVLAGVGEGITADKFAAAEAVLVDFKDGDIDSALKTIITGTVEGVTAAQIAEAKAIVEGGIKSGVTAAQIAEAKAIVEGGIKSAVTQIEVDTAQTVINAATEATQKQIAAQEFIVQVLNDGVKVENPTQKQIDAAQAKYEEYVNTYTAEKVDLVIGIYGLTSKEDEDTFLAMVNTYGSIENINKAKAFVSAGGVDAVKALINTGHIETALYSANDKTTTMDDFITQIKPDVSGAASGTTAGVNAVGGAIGGHQQSVVVSSGKYGLKKHSLSVTKQLGMSSGGGIRSTGAWMKVFGSTSEMDMRDSISGYDADANGIVVGIDKTFGDLMIGAAISVADIDVDGKSIANSSTDSDQFQGTLYGTMMMDSYYINGSFALAHTSSDTSRIGLKGGVTGSYDTDTYAISLGAGVPIDMGSMSIIPQAVASYTSISPDSYTESGIGALHVDAENMESFGIKAGVAVSSTIAIDGGIIAPKVRLMADWDVTQKKAVVNSSWVGDVDNTIYSTSGAKPASLGAIIGAGVDYASDDGLYVFSLDYDLSKRSDFTSHAGSVKVRVNF